MHRFLESRSPKGRIGGSRGGSSDSPSPASNGPNPGAFGGSQGSSQSSGRNSNQRNNNSPSVDVGGFAGSTSPSSFSSSSSSTSTGQSTFGSSSSTSSSPTSSTSAASSQQQNNAGKNGWQRLPVGAQIFIILGIVLVAMFIIGLFSVVLRKRQEMRRFNRDVSFKKVLWESFKSVTGIACLMRRFGKGSKDKSNGGRAFSYDKVNRQSYEESIATRDSFIEYGGERWYDPNAPPRPPRRERHKRPSRYDPDFPGHSRTVSSVSAVSERIVPPWEQPLPHRAPWELSATSPSVSPASSISHPHELEVSHLSELEASPVTKPPTVAQSSNGGSASV